MAEKTLVKIKSVPSRKINFAMKLSRHEKEKLDYILEKQNITAITFFSDCIEQVFNELISNNFKGV